MPWLLVSPSCKSARLTFEPSDEQPDRRHDDCCATCPLAVSTVFSGHAGKYIFKRGDLEVPFISPTVGCFLTYQAR